MRFGYEWETLAGSHHDIGVAHGRDNAERMRHLLAAFKPNLAAPWSEAEFLGPLEKHLPHLAEEVHGIVEGSGMTLREVVALSFLVDLGTTGSACTGVVFADGPDGPVVGKTSDCTPGVHAVSVEHVLSRELQALGVPAVAGLPFGHDLPNEPLLLGADAELDAERGTFRLGELDQLGC